MEDRLTESHVEGFQLASAPLIEWLRANMHPHSYVLVDSLRAELLEGILLHKGSDQSGNENWTVGRD